MTQTGGRHSDESGATLDRYLDGLLAGAERDAFERRLEADPALRDEQQRQESIDASLRRSFAPPLEPALRRIAVAGLATDNGHAAAERATGGRPHAGRRLLPEPRGTRRLRFPRRSRALAVAASIALCAGGAYLAWRALAPGAAFRPYALPERQTLLAAYHAQVADGLKPLWICRDDREFQDAFRRRLGLALSMEPLPENAAAAGLDYANTISPWTIEVLARVDGEPVIVFVDRAERDTSPALPEESTLHLYRRVVDGLVAYEVSPLPAPAVLPHLRPAPPEDPAGSGAPPVDPAKEPAR